MTTTENTTATTCESTNKLSVENLERRTLRNNRASRIFLNFVGENIMDDLVRRHNRPYSVLRPLVKELLAEHGISAEQLKWSKKAGCSMCPCSPGFIVTGHNGEDFWIDVTTTDS